MKNPIFDIDNWREITATLSRNKTRTFLTAFGIFWGTAMHAMLMGGAQGVRGLMMRNFDGFATNSAFIFSSNTTIAYKGYQKGREWSLTQGDVDALRIGVPEIDAISGIVQAGGAVSYRDKSYVNGNILGFTPDYYHVMEPRLIEGRLLNESDEMQLRKNCLIGARVASELFGTESPIGKYVQANNIYYRIVGVVRPRNDNVNIGGNMEEMLMLPLAVMRQNYNLGEKVYYVAFTVRDGCTPGKLRGRIKRILQSRHTISPEDDEAVPYWDISENFEQVDGLFSGIDLLAIFVGFGSLLAGIIGVGNIMWIIVKERTQEIGIRRAIGARPRDIIAQILSEAVVLTTVAGVGGICFAVFILAVAGRLTAGADGSEVGFQLAFSTAFAILGVFLVLGMGAGIIPAVKAMRIKPIEALNDN